jgi:hypothetical protein
MEREGIGKRTRNQKGDQNQTWQHPEIPVHTRVKGNPTKGGYKTRIYFQGV